jgi:hypothetical protein
MSKPIGMWISLFFFVVGLAMIWMARTPSLLIIIMVLMFVSLLHPIYHFWWIEKTRLRRITAIVIYFILIILFGYIVWPSRELPNILKVSLIQMNNYSPSLHVNGVKWQKNYREYLFTISNQDEKTELFDSRIEIEPPWIIVKYDIENNHGTQEVRLSQPKSSAGIADKKTGRILETVDFYVNNLMVDIVRLFPKGSFDIRIIAKKEDIPTDRCGSITISYKYLNNSGQKAKKSVAFHIHYKDNVNYEGLFVDVEHPIKVGESYGSCFRTEIKEGILLFDHNGSITYDKTWKNQKNE